MEREGGKGMWEEDERAILNATNHFGWIGITYTPMPPQPVTPQVPCSTATLIPPHLSSSLQFHAPQSLSSPLLSSSSSAALLWGVVV